MAKEGKDFEWRTVPGSNAKARHFFTKAEKAERAKPKPKAKRKTTSRASSRKMTKEAPVTPLSKPSKIMTESLDPIAVGARAALARDEKRERMESYDPPTKGRSKRRVPGKAIADAIRNAFRGEGETNPAKIVRRGYAKGGMVKANCGASRAPRRKMK